MLERGKKIFLSILIKLHVYSVHVKYFFFQYGMIFEYGSRIFSSVQSAHDGIVRDVMEKYNVSLFCGHPVSKCLKKNA